MRIIVGVLCVLFATTVFAANRVPRPPLLSLPLDQSQINQLNDYITDIWNLTNGEYNFDIETTTKTNASNGDIWLIQTGNIVRIQWKANGRVFTGQEETD